MRPPLLPLLLAWCAHGALAQSVTPDVRTSSGGYGASSTTNVSWSIGEPMTETAVGSSASLTQGFEQPRFNLTIGMIENEPAWNISAYPNPTSDMLSVELADDHVDANAVLFDAVGKRAIEQRIIARRTTLDLSALPAGEYLLDLRDRMNGKRAQFTINKTH